MYVTGRGTKAVSKLHEVFYGSRESNTEPERVKQVNILKLREIIL